MEKYERLIGTPGVYGHITRKGAGSPGSMEILDTTTDVFNPAGKSFVYLIIPGTAGVKFSIMEEDGVRVSDARVGFTYLVGMQVTGRFNRLKVESGSCAIYLADALDYTPQYPALGQIARTAQFRPSIEGDIIVPLVFPENYALFEGEDLGFILKIEREDMDDLADFAIGDILLRTAAGATVETLTEYTHTNTELEATLTEGVATYYIAISNSDLSSSEVYEAMKATASNLLIKLQLKVEGDYKVSVALVEMNESEGTLETSGNIFATRTTDIEVPEASDEAAILTFGIPNQVGPTEIDHEAGTIELTMPHGTTVTALVAAFTTSAHIESIKVGVTDQVTAVTANNFTSDVTYAVVAEDGTTSQDYVVTVNLADASEEANILSYSIPGQMGDTKINTAAGTIQVLMPYGTVVTALVATFTTSPGIASIVVGSTGQVSGTTANNFTSAVTYVVTAQDTETTKNWVVTVGVNDL